MQIFNGVVVRHLTLLLCVCHWLCTSTTTVQSLVVVLLVVVLLVVLLLLVVVLVTATGSASAIDSEGPARGEMIQLEVQLSLSSST